MTKGSAFQILRLLDHNNAASVSAVRSIDDAQLVEPLLETLADRSAVVPNTILKQIITLLLPTCPFDWCQIQSHFQFAGRVYHDLLLGQWMLLLVDDWKQGVFALCVPLSEQNKDQTLMFVIC